MVMNCPHCDKDLTNLKPTQKGAHITSCKNNPKRKEISDKISKTRLKNQREKNPILKLKLNCLWCGKEFEIEIVESYYKRGRYQKCCCKHCAALYSSKSMDYNLKKVSKCKYCEKEIITNLNRGDNVCCDECKKNYRKKRYKSKIFVNGKWICRLCGEEKCERPDICRKLNIKNNVFMKYFNFDINKIGTKQVYDEVDRIVKQLKKDYFENELSLTDIGKKYGTCYQTINSIFKNLKIKIRNSSESVYLAVKNGKKNYDNTYSPLYKHGHHITWDGREVHYRSSYELDYYKILDEQKIYYEVEKLKLIYYDTQKKRRRIAIPDIYIPEQNLIIELKSMWTYDKQNWTDRLKTYKKLKYNIRLIIGESKNGINKIIEEINY